MKTVGATQSLLATRESCRDCFIAILHCGCDVWRDLHGRQDALTRARIDLECVPGEEVNGLSGVDATDEKLDRADEDHEVDVDALAGRYRTRELLDV